MALVEEKSDQLQRRAKAISQRNRPGSRRGLMRSGASARRSHFKAIPMTPGIASGMAWLGVRVPQLPCELPLPTGPWSITVTLRPDPSR